jgi:alpha-2-macroglobulin
MSHRNPGVWLGVVFVGLLGVLAALAVEAPPPDRVAAQKLLNDKNFKEAYELFSALALDPKDDPAKVRGDFENAYACLLRLNRLIELDAFREKVVAAHGRNWQLLAGAADTLLANVHEGQIVGGEFKRGHNSDSTGKPVHAYERDRVRALQLMAAAMKLAEKEADKDTRGLFYRDLAKKVMAQREGPVAWRLQELTDLSALPDYEDGWYGYRYWGGSVRGAPVEEDGTPVYHHLPKSWEAARSDGERWRWALTQWAECGATCKGDSQAQFASFLLSQFGVQTAAEYRWYFYRGQDDDSGQKTQDAVFQLHTLGEEETIAKLATGIRRFKLPDEFNFIKIYKELNNFSMLGQIFEDRRQYPKAAECWKKAQNDDRVQRIVGNWGQFESRVTQAAGQPATVDFRFRNGRKVHVTAHEVLVPKRLEDLKAYMKSNPKPWDYQKADLEGFDHRLVEANMKQYVGEKVAEWDAALEPLADHFDRVTTLKTPLQKPGAYFLTATMEDGNTCHIVAWVADTAIVKKNVEKGNFYFVADAATGKPIAKANLEFFGYRQESRERADKKGYDTFTVTKDFAEFTDADGQVVVDRQRQDQNYQWVIIATTPDGRLAYSGIQAAWGGGGPDKGLSEARYYLITDRPVYRPKQKVEFKVWANQVGYEREGDSPFARQKFFVRVTNPKGEKFFEGTFTSDDYGGFDGSFELPDQAPLGVYSVQLTDRNHYIGSFRVEEYKKPEFEVKVEAPEEPVMLGEKISVRVVSKYYFGAPVAEAKISYKVLRSEYAAHGYPWGLWDWMYGNGYWWYAYDYAWYPGWRSWGCCRPVPWWWGGRGGEPPEVVAQGEAKVEKDGTFKIEIDTALAKAVHGDQDHKYEVTAEVTDASRRTIVGQGQVLVARQPFKVYAWVDRGHYSAGDVVRADFRAQTLDNKPVKGPGALELVKISYDKDGKPTEKSVQKWDLPTGEEGTARVQMKAAEAGQYRLSYKVTDSKKHVIEGGYIFSVRGEGGEAGQFRFNDLELVPDQREYKPGDKVQLMVNTNQAGSTVLLFPRARDGTCQAPRTLRLKGKSTLEALDIAKQDMPNFFVEALTVSAGKVFSEVREVLVPPETRTLDVTVTPSAKEYKPSEKARLKVQVKDAAGKPYSGSLVLAIYDKSVEYISGGSNVPEIKEFFWKWRRSHHLWQQTNLERWGYCSVSPGGRTMQMLGAFGNVLATAKASVAGGMADAVMPAPAIMDEAAPSAGNSRRSLAPDSRMPAEAAQGPGQPAMVEPTVRSNFADTALWKPELHTDDGGQAEVELVMPENLTTWKARAWAMGGGSRVGEGTVEVVTTKNLIIRLQAPRFFVQKDEVVLSANVHNYLKTKKSVKVVLGPLTDILKATEETTKKCVMSDVSGLPGVSGEYYEQTVEIAAGGEKRVDWRVKVAKPGQALVRMKALTDEESDAMEMTFPAYVHGMLKVESFCGVIRPDKDLGTIAIKVPEERRPEQSRLEIRYSPTLAGAMLDALPYLADYPYGCTEQTLNRFLPAVLVQKVLLKQGLDLKDIAKQRANLNPGELAAPGERARKWGYEAVFDEKKLLDIVKTGVERLTNMQCQDGGWGWFSGDRESSSPHTTATVVHGLQIARENDIAIPPDVLRRGTEWLKRYQTSQVAELQRYVDTKGLHGKQKADAVDALCYRVLADEKIDSKEMMAFLYRDRADLPVYAQALFGLGLHVLGHKEERDRVIRNIDQFLNQDEENQTAYLRLPQTGWWYWYNSDMEADASYLKLLVATDPKGEKASRLVKYIINNRRSGTYWTSTRDTSLCIETLADFMKASGEGAPDMTITVLLDGKALKEVKVTRENLFSFDASVVLEGEKVPAGAHKIEIKKKGTGTLYYNAFLTNFTLEDFITKAGLEIKVDRKFYQLVKVDAKATVAGSRGEVVGQKSEKYERKPLENLAQLKSGDLVEVELLVDAKNDYEYLLLEDMKAAGLEPVEVRSGYSGNSLGAYMELRDERVCLFIRWLARGQHSLTYRLRAETPGQFSALPTKASAMYAPELKANSDEMKLRITD